MIEALALAALLQASSEQRPLPLPVPAPYEGEWVVEVIDNIKVLPESRVTMTIRGGSLTGQSSLTGMASCNTYRGSFIVTQDSVRVSPVLKTMKSCDPPRMSEEADFFKLLQDVSGFDIRKDSLVLTTRDGKSISARRAAGSSSQL